MESNGKTYTNLIIMGRLWYRKEVIASSTWLWFEFLVSVRDIIWYLVYNAVETWCNIYNFFVRSLWLGSIQNMSQFYVNSKVQFMKRSFAGHTHKTPQLSLDFFYFAEIIYFVLRCSLFTSIVLVFLCNENGIQPKQRSFGGAFIVHFNYSFSNFVLYMRRE